MPVRCGCFPPTTQRGSVASLSKSISMHTHRGCSFASLCFSAGTLPRLCNAGQSFSLPALHNAYPSRRISDPFFAIANHAEQIQGITALCHRHQFSALPPQFGSFLRSSVAYRIVSPPMLSTLSRSIAMSRCVLLLFAVAWRLNAAPSPGYAKPLPSRLCFSLASPSVASAIHCVSAPSLLSGLLRQSTPSQCRSIP